VACLAELAFASKIEPFATVRQRCREAIALAELHGWGEQSVVAPALVNLAGALIWTGEFGEGEFWVKRAARAVETDTGPVIRLLMHIATGALLAGRRRRRDALAEFSASSACRRSWKACMRSRVS
jgi:LuxR family transcriptional regulator, maltose regulon positive regulatory protein